jgi:hypothetical protein
MAKRVCKHWPKQAIREGASEKELDAIRDKHDKYDENNTCIKEVFKS